MQQPVPQIYWRYAYPLTVLFSISLFLNPCFFFSWYLFLKSCEYLFNLSAKILIIQNILFHVRKLNELKSIFRKQMTGDYKIIPGLVFE